MHMKKTENEYLYMQTDDTVDVGKEPLPIVTEKDKRRAERAQKIIKKFMEELKEDKKEHFD